MRAAQPPQLAIEAPPPRLALEAPPPPRRGAARAGAGAGGAGERAAEPAAPLLHHGLRPQAARAPAPDDGQRRQHVRGRPPRRTRALHRGQQPLHGGAGARDAGPARRLQRPLRRERRLRSKGGARGRAEIEVIPTKPLELGRIDVDSADFWTNRSLSSRSRSTAEGPRVETVDYARIEVGSKIREFGPGPRTSSST